MKHSAGTAWRVTAQPRDQYRHWLCESLPPRATGAGDRAWNSVELHPDRGCRDHHHDTERGHGAQSLQGPALPTNTCNHKLHLWFCFAFFFFKPILQNPFQEQPNFTKSCWPGGRGEGYQSSENKVHTNNVQGHLQPSLPSCH